LKKYNHLKVNKKMIFPTIQKLTISGNLPSTLSELTQSKVHGRCGLLEYDYDIIPQIRQSE
jgi:hypothetical protein